MAKKKNVDSVEIPAPAESSTLPAVPVSSMNYQKVIPATPDFPFERTLEFLPLSELEKTANIRMALYERQNAENNLTNPIEIEGLKTPLLARIRKDGSLDRIRGGSRCKALRLYQKRAPEKFEVAFPGELIPVYMVKATDAEAARLRADHADTMGLSHKYELYCACYDAFDAGLSPRQVAEELQGLFVQFSSKIGQSPKWKEVQDLRRDVRLGTLKGADAADALKRATELTKQMFYPQAQDREREWETPWVLDAYKVIFTKERPESGPLSDPGFKVPESLSKNDVKRLKAAHDKDRAEKPAEVTLKNPGTHFRAVWQELCSKVKTKPQKAMSAKELDKVVERLESKGLRAALNLAARKGEEVENRAAMKDADSLLEIGEYAKLHLPQAWAALEAEVIRHRAEREAAAKATAQEAVDAA